MGRNWIKELKLVINIQKNYLNKTEMCPENKHDVYANLERRLYCEFSEVFTDE